ncbi:LCP family protein [Diaminobutyricibacter sp. McL0618]|uniref:LCP family protein n=1 Tax=Leifsonia sp. McL0618 TaxID=3415677 RepID=UPI003CF89866
MSDLRPRTNRKITGEGDVSTIARHGQLKRRNPFPTLAKIVAAVVGVALVSSMSVAAIAAWDVTTSVHKSVTLVDAKGKAIVPQVGAIDGSFNVLLAGSDSGDGNAAYGTRGENLNDVTMLLHVSADHKNATVVSFPRDMFVAIPSCPDPKGGSFDAMSYQKINNTLTYGGLACTVLTVEKLTGLTIPYAGVIQFDGVIEMSNAVGGVPVCVAGDITDPYTGLNVKAGQNTLQGAQALAFLRTRHGVGDGSDLGRISNQQVFLSSLVRTIKSADTLANPVKVYALAKAAASNMSLSESLNNPTTIASMAIAMKGIDLNKVVFVQYPNHYVQDGVAPTEDAATALMTALQNDQPVVVTGDTGVGSVTDPKAPPAATAPSTPGTSTTAPSSGASTTAPSTGSSGSGSGSGSAVDLPSDVHGQTAGQYTCSKPFSG